MPICLHHLVMVSVKGPAHIFSLLTSISTAVILPLSWWPCFLLPRENRGSQKALPYLSTPVPWPTRIFTTHSAFPWPVYKPSWSHPKPCLLKDIIPTTVPLTVHFMATISSSLIHSVQHPGLLSFPPWKYLSLDTRSSPSHPSSPLYL